MWRNTDNHPRSSTYSRLRRHVDLQNLTINQRYINTSAIVNFGFTLQAAWEAAGVSFQFSLLNGGPASLVYGSLFTWIGSTLIATSLAEMSSMYDCSCAGAGPSDPR